MSELITTRVRDNALRLGLTHLADGATQLVTRAEADNLGYLDLVDLLLEEELGLREGRRFRNALKLSGLPHHKTIDEFDFAFQTDLDPRKIRDLAALTFVADKSNVALLGPPGVGKTHIAVSTRSATCRSGERRPTWSSSSSRADMSAARSCSPRKGVQRMGPSLLRRRPRHRHPRP